MSEPSGVAVVGSRRADKSLVAVVLGFLMEAVPVILVQVVVRSLTSDEARTTWVWMFSRSELVTSRRVGLLIGAKVCRNT